MRIILPIDAEKVLRKRNSIILKLPIVQFPKRHSLGSNIISREKIVRVDKSKVLYVAHDFVRKLNIVFLNVISYNDTMQYLMYLSNPYWCDKSFSDYLDDDVILYLPTVPYTKPAIVGYLENIIEELEEYYGKRLIFFHLKSNVVIPYLEIISFPIVVREGLVLFKKKLWRSVLLYAGSKIFVAKLEKMKARIVQEQETPPQVLAPSIF